MPKRRLIIILLCLTLGLLLTGLAQSSTAQISFVRNLTPKPSPVMAQQFRQREPLHKIHPEFAGNQVLVELKTSDQSILFDPKKDPIIKNIYQQFGAPQITPIFKLPPGVRSWEDQIKKVKQKFRARAKRTKAKFTYALDRFYKLGFSVSDDELAKIIDQLRQSPNIKSVSYNYIYHPCLVPNDPYFASSGTWGQSYADLWGLYKISAPAAWKRGARGSKDILIAIVDTGVDIGHADIIDNIYTNPGEIANNGIDDDLNDYIDDTTGWDFYYNNNNPNDDNYHGTHVAGIAAATTNNNLGISGVTTAQILPIKVGNCYGSMDATSIAQGILYATHQGADVINLSLGGGGSTAMQVAIDYAYGMGVVVIAAAGNDAEDALEHAPANYDQVITVAASNYLDTLTSFSNFGPKIDVTAPGEDILSLRASGGTKSSTESDVVGIDYLRLSGTSMAAPYVTGATALLLAKDPSLTVEEIRQAIRSADDIDTTDWDENTGYGRLNLSKAAYKPTKCEALITNPAHCTEISPSTITVSGYAGGADFSKYRLSLLEAGESIPKTVVSTPKIPCAVSGGTLGTLTPPSITIGKDYLLLLEVFDKKGKVGGRDIKKLSRTYTLGKMDISNPQDLIINGNYLYVADYTSGLFIIDISSPSSPTLLSTSSSAINIGALAMSGNYLYGATPDGLTILNIEDPSHALVAATYDTESPVQDIFIEGNYAYLVEYASLQILDLSTPETPIPLGSYPLSHPQSVIVKDNYAYVADYTEGLKIINVSSPSSPTLVGYCDTPGSAWAVAVSDNYAYVADGSSGLQVIDISNPFSPSLIATYLDPYSSSNFTDITIEGIYAYIKNENQLTKVSIFIPSNPFFAATYTFADALSAFKINGSQAVAAISASGIAIISLTAPDAPAAVCVATYDTPGTAYAVTLDKDHNLAYVADGSNLQIVEIKPPALTLAGSCSPYTLATNLTIDNSYVYLAEELDRKLDIINVASPSSPLVAATYSSTGWGRIYATAIKDNYAYVANGTDGLSILNISTPSSPAFVSQCKTSAEARDVVVNGNYAYVADATSGLQTIDISNPSAPLLVDSDDTAGNANAIAICGDYLYVADWTGGLQIFDIVAPSNPAWVANYSTDWASDVFIDDHYVYVAARSSGLYILDITNPLTPSLVIHYNPASIIYGVWADGPYALLAAGESGLEVVFLYLP